MRKSNHEDHEEGSDSDPVMSGLYCALCAFRGSFSTGGRCGEKRSALPKSAVAGREKGRAVCSEAAAAEAVSKRSGN
jgi:hypothetical protein